tara:strand:+ start:10331 stop:10780 length:450 start_codon:yes stop_codon:yes gene_type:complete
MLLIKATGSTVEQYPYSVGLLRKQNPNTSFPKQVSAEDMAAFNAYLVTEVTPTISSTQKLVKNSTPTLVGSEWILAHEAVDLTSEDIAEATAILAANARVQRGKLLAATDFYALSDVVMTSEMTTYRSDLRAVPAQSDFPATITWPTAP